jgi:hypothetical protein
MKQQFFSLKDAALILGVQAYRITYLLTTGKVSEPTRIGGKRVFDILDLHRIAKKLSIEHIDELIAANGRSEDV